jgi:hypothetical protein
MITSRDNQQDDAGNFVHGCFMVKVGSDFQTFTEIMQHALQDEINGSTGNPKVDPYAAQVLASVGGSDPALPDYFSKNKCRDTSLGGNDALNPLPSFPLDDDIVHPHNIPNFPGNSKGMGQVYSDNYDDTQQILYLGFGIPVYNNIGNFWSGAVDSNYADYINKGTGMTVEKIGYLIGRTPIAIVQMATIPYKFLAAQLNALEYIPITKYYTFSSQMPMYFRFVNTILVYLATNMNMLGSLHDKSVFNTGATATDEVTGGTTPGQDLSGMSTVFRDYGLDMARIMTKRFLMERGDDPIKNRYTDQALFTASDNMGKAEAAATPATTTSTNPTANGTNDPTATPDNGVSVTTGAKYWASTWFDAFGTAYKDTLYDGHLFVGLRIDKGLGGTESFSNNTGESQAAAFANSKFQEGSNVAFTTMRGQFGESLVGQALSSAVGGLKALFQGAADSFSMDPLAAAISGAAKIDIPDVWMGSSYSRSQSFSITCLAPYGDPETIFQTEYVPLACVLAGSLPRGTGHASHSAPFVCQAYCRGVFSSPLCMVESLSITRGADQFGWTMSRLPLKLQMQITLKDLSPTMSMQMAGTSDIAKSILGGDSSFGEYMMTLSGMGLRDRLSPYKAMRRKFEILLNSVYKNKLSPFMLGMEGGSQFIISRAISTIISSGRGLPGN